MKKLLFLLIPLWSYSQSATFTAKGSLASKTNATTLTITSVAVSAGTTLVVGVVYSATFTSLTWNGNAMTLDVNNSGSSPSTRIYSFYSASGGTGDIVLTVGGTVNYKALTAYQIGNMNSSTPKDLSSSNSGSSTTPTSNATGTTSQADEIWIGIIGWNGPSGDTPGSWSNSFTDDGQRTGTTGGSATTNVTIQGGYRIVSATGTATAATGANSNSRAWNANVVTYKCTAPSITNTHKGQMFKIF